MQVTKRIMQTRSTKHQGLERVFLIYALLVRGLRTITGRTVRRKSH